MAFEVVYTMSDWYDHPRGGVASFNGKPHFYESLWNDINRDKDDVYLLTPISDEILALAIEDWTIWLRWLAAFERKETTKETHPCLPEDRARKAELDAVLGKSLKVDQETAFTATATFRYGATTWQSTEAEWTVVDFKPSINQLAN